jgi:hypothetical protein
MTPDEAHSVEVEVVVAEVVDEEALEIEEVEEVDEEVGEDSATGEVEVVDEGEERQGGT